MDFMARAVWIYQNEVITIDTIKKLTKYGIKVVYIDPMSDNHVAEIENLRGSGITVGAYFADSWNEQMTPSQWAKWVSNVLNEVLKHEEGFEAPPCMLDLETHDTVRQAAVIKAYKSHQPARPTCYTNAPFQAPLVPWNVLRTYRLPYYVQLYNGDMSPADAARAVLEVCRYYGSASLVHPFYDGSHYGTDQTDGCYFTLERMP